MNWIMALRELEQYKQNNSNLEYLRYMSRDMKVNGKLLFFLSIFPKKFVQYP